MNVDKKLIVELISYIKKFECIEKVVLFGSRAREDNSERSDYDIAIYGKVPYSVQSDIRYFCDETLWTLHKIDLVFVNANTYPKLLRNIEREGVTLYEQN